MLAQSAGAAEYTNCISTERQDSYKEYSGYHTKQSDCEASVRLVLWGMWSTSWLASLPDPLQPGVVALDRVISVGPIELLDI